MSSHKYQIATDLRERLRRSLFVKEEEYGREEEYEKYFLKDILSFLLSPDGNSQRELYQTNKSHPATRNFIQHGTNLTSSIWSAVPFSLIQDGSGPWEQVRECVGSSDIRNTLYWATWKLPVVSGYSSNKKEEDFEGKTLYIKDDGFFSLSNDGSDHFSQLQATDEVDHFEKISLELQEPEDLYHSMNSYFKPIKADSDEVKYIDGYSFDGAKLLEEMNARRLKSSHVYKRHDQQKYMEYRRNDLNSSPKFVPKFLVCPNDKACQTDLLQPEEDTSVSKHSLGFELLFSRNSCYIEKSLSETSPRNQVGRDWIPSWPLAPVFDQMWIYEGDYLCPPWALPSLNDDSCDKKEESDGTKTIDTKDEKDSNHLTISQSSDTSDNVETPEHENLFYSKKTRFEPIEPGRDEVKYVDGYSFDGAKLLEVMSARFLESGQSYHGVDQKYMEYRRNDLNLSPKFVPKFRVCPNDKSCQTKNPPPGFFFPTPEGSLNEPPPRIPVRDWVTLMFLAPGSDDIFRNSSHRTWSIGEDEDCTSTDGTERSEHYNRLRHEINSEGDQLLSHLSSINFL